MKWFGYKFMSAMSCHTEMMTMRITRNNQWVVRVSVCVWTLVCCELLYISSQSWASVDSSVAMGSRGDRSSFLIQVTMPWATSVFRLTTSGSTSCWTLYSSQSWIISAHSLTHADELGTQIHNITQTASVDLEVNWLDKVQQSWDTVHLMLKLLYAACNNSSQKLVSNSYSLQ